MAVRIPIPRSFLSTALAASSLAACAVDGTDGELYLGMSEQHFKRVSCRATPNQIKKVAKVRAFDCLRSNGQYTVEIYGGEVFAIHRPDGRNQGHNPVK